jgi:allantoicase
VLNFASLLPLVSLCEKLKNMSTHAFGNMIDIAAERLGGKALLCTDDFFAEKENY